MPYDSVISRTDKEALIPEDVSADILQHVPESSAVMRLARRLPDMSRAQRRLPVVSMLPTAYFVTGDTGLKRTTEVNWESKYVDAEELAVIVPVPQSVVDDQDYDIWGEVRPHLIEAFGKAIDAAVLYGTNIPASWTTNLGAAGLLAWCTAASATLSIAAYTDLYEAIMGEAGDGTNGVLMTIEEDGFIPNGHLAHISMRGLLRNCRDSDGNLIFKSSMQESTRYELDGAEMIFPLNGSMVAASALMFSGDWSQLVWAMRQDITFKIATEGVIEDAQGATVHNLFQQDMIALRAVMRLGFALPNPINRMEETEANRSAFAALTA